jgi:predicted  nucleic acid-binding Zn-ribbon protein
MSWRDQYRDRKDASGKTWDEFVRTELHHEDELDDLRSQVERLTDDVDALTEHVEDLRNNIGEVLILVRSENDD